MQKLQEVAYSNYSKYSKINNLNYSNNSNYSKLRADEVFGNLADIIPVDDYLPFYVSKFKEIGYERFMALANMARRYGKDPQRLFFWYLKNNASVNLIKDYPNYKGGLHA